MTLSWEHPGHSLVTHMPPVTVFARDKIERCWTIADLLAQICHNMTFGIFFSRPETGLHSQGNDNRYFGIMKIIYQQANKEIVTGY